MPKVLLTEKINKEALKILLDNNFDVKIATSIDEETLKEEVKNVDAILVQCTELNDNIISSAKKLKIISRHGTGVNNIDIESATRNKVLVCKVDGLNSYSVAEYYISMMINLSRNFFILDSYFKEGKFIDANTTLPNLALKYNLNGEEITNKNLLILGYGSIGKELAKIAKFFKMNVYIYHPREQFNDFKTFNNLFEALEIADFVTICTPLNQETKNLITKKELSKLKKTCIILNAARGGIINENDLAFYLNNDLIRGAAVDVFQEEVPINSPLLGAKNCILTPHIAGSTKKAMKDLSLESAKNIVDYFNGIIPRTTVNL